MKTQTNPKEGKKTECEHKIAWDELVSCSECYKQISYLEQKYIMHRIKTDLIDEIVEEVKNMKKNYSMGMTGILVDRYNQNLDEIIDCLNQKRYEKN